MKKIILLIFCALFLYACANKKNTTTPKINSQLQVEETEAKLGATTWNRSKLSATTIKKVQQDKDHYTQCIYQESQKQGYKKIDSRVATDTIIKQCEFQLSKIRETFIDGGVPEIIADRYLKKTRTEITRKILRSFMFAEAARKASAIQ